MTLPVNVLSMSERLVFQISMPGATKLVIAFADSNQLANVKLSL
jgi:hypothetical protein